MKSLTHHTDRTTEGLPRAEAAPGPQLHSSHPETDVEEVFHPGQDPSKNGNAEPLPCPKRKEKVPNINKHKAFSFPVWSLNLL